MSIKFVRAPHLDTKEARDLWLRVAGWSSNRDREVEYVDGTIKNFNINLNGQGHYCVLSLVDDEAYIYEQNLKGSLIVIIAPIEEIDPHG